MSASPDWHAHDSLTKQRAMASMPFRETVRSGTDPDQLSEALSTPKAPIKVTAQGGTSIAYHCNFISLEDVGVADCSYDGTIHCQREGVVDKIAVFLPTAGNMTFSGGGEPIYSTPGKGLILESGHAGSSSIVGPRRHLCLFVDRAKMLTRLGHMFERTISGDLGFHPHFDLTAGPGLVLQQLVSNLHSGLSRGSLLQRSPVAVNALCDAATYLLLEACPHRYSDQLARPAPAPAPRHVKRAIEFMQEHVAELQSLDDIAAAAGVSIRTLQQGFRQFKNTTPTAYLHEIRMLAVHRELCESGGSQAVADIALRWGFTHLGRFAGEYRKRFGQLPSQTLKR
ncbi:AraC family transcriptional regulator [Rhizobium vallis]|uniref:AraC family transcriptional regulator n=1 Tax=Rhizobium vallis TaxID=634290 RepID=A0A3S0QS43_9HYPH|nr:AraC family transcriptional regulator [Rhizobium vallis]RUM22163.1 AraC family transcriptional regulator [Rhizobium vallis]